MHVEVELEAFVSWLCLHDYQCWPVLPCWAKRFSYWVESCPRRPATGCEVLDVLAAIELALRPA